MTKRRSRSEPEIQNIPVRTPEVRAVRNAFLQSMFAYEVFRHMDFTELEMRVRAVSPEDIYKGFPKDA